MVTVPNVVTEVPALTKNPVFLYFEDGFQKPAPFRPDIAVSIDDVVDKKVDALDAHVSQVYEWLAWHSGNLDQVPKDPTARKAWLKKTRMRPPSAQVREALVKWYGADAGGKVQVAEAFECASTARGRTRRCCGGCFRSSRRSEGVGRVWGHPAPYPPPCPHTPHAPTPYIPAACNETRVTLAAPCASRTVARTPAAVVDGTWTMRLWPTVEPVAMRAICRQRRPRPRSRRRAGRRGCLSCSTTRSKVSAAASFSMAAPSTDETAAPAVRSRRTRDRGARASPSAR